MFERAWAEREERVYKSFFNNMPGGIYTPTDPNQVAIGGEKLILSHAGVFEIPPSIENPYWTFITSGLSNPHDENPQLTSGYGIELFIQLSEQSTWQINLMFNLMGYILETGNVFASGDRMPCNGPIIAGDQNCQLTTVLFWAPTNLPHSFQLESGMVEMLQIHGITDSEYDFAKNHSSLELYAILQNLPNFPTIDTSRGSAVT